MRLIYTELKTILSQKLRAPKNLFVVAVRPHLYRFNLPAGNLILEILDDEDNVIATSEPIVVAEVGTDSFLHGYVRFDIVAGLSKNRVYTFRLSSDGYTFSESAFVGWCNGYDLGKYQPEYLSSNSLKAPLDLEVWERKSI